MKILCLFVRHGTAQYPEALTELDQWYQRHSLINERTLWIIDNALEPNCLPQLVAPATHLRPGSNHAWEFSAWDRTLAEAAAEGISYDIVHFVTSAFNTLYNEYLKHFRRDMLDYTLARNTCLGHLDSFPELMQLEDETFQTWVRTCFFFLTRTSIQKLPRLATYQDPDRFFVAPDSREFRPDAPLGLAYQRHIRAWLEGQEIGGHSWHSPVRQGKEENVRFQRKTLAILNEQRLAITLRRAGIRLADFCWLFSLRNAPFSAEMAPPTEVDQLRARRRILGIPA